MSETQGTHWEGCEEVHHECKIAKLQRDLARVTAERDAWRNAVIDELVVAHIYRKQHDDCPRLAVMDAIGWNCGVALDPQVSSEARKLVADAAARAESAERDAYEKVLRGLRSENDSTQLRAIIAQVEALRDAAIEEGKV